MCICMVSGKGYICNYIRGYLASDTEYMSGLLQYWRLIENIIIITQFETADE